MQSFGGITIGLVSFFFSVEAAKIYAFFIMRHLSHPAFIFFFHPRQAANTLQTTLVSAFAICPVLSVSGFAEVFKPIVQFISIDMINVKLWHKTSHIEPCKPVRRISFPIHFNVSVSSAFANIPRFRSNLNSGARTRPYKYPSLGIVRKNGCKVRMFHKGILPDLREDCNLLGIKYA